MTTNDTPIALEDVYKRAFNTSIETKQKLLNEHMSTMVALANMVTDTFRTGHKVMLCGNGGSAADAQHIAAEWVVRYKSTRPALPALALTANTSDLTAIGNDFGFDEIFSRQLKAHGNTGDLLIAISTSGTSKNIIRAVETAKNNGVTSIALTGNDGGKLAQIADTSLIVPSDETARIQEAHTTVLHVICEVVDQQLFSV